MPCLFQSQHNTFVYVCYIVCVYLFLDWLNQHSFFKVYDHNEWIFPPVCHLELKQAYSALENVEGVWSHQIILSLQVIIEPVAFLKLFLVVMIICILYDLDLKESKCKLNIKINMLWHFMCCRHFDEQPVVVSYKLLCVIADMWCITTYIMDMFYVIHELWKWKLKIIMSK